MRPKDDAKIEAIFEASLKLIGEVGIAGATMARIAREAGVATGTLYTYFATKEELLRRLYVRVKARAVENFVRDLPGDLPFRIAFRRVWTNMLTFNAQRKLESAFMAQYYRSTYIDEATRAEGTRLFQPVLDLLDRGKRNSWCAMWTTPCCAPTVHAFRGQASRAQAETDGCPRPASLHRYRLNDNTAP